MANRYIIDGELVSADVYNKVKYDSMLVRFPKGQKDVIQSHAAARGESVNGFIGRAITETMERDGADAAQDAVKSADGGGGNSTGQDGNAARSRTGRDTGGLIYGDQLCPRRRQSD